MIEQGDWIASIQNIIQQMRAAEVTELEMRQGDLCLRLRRNPRQGGASSLPGSSECTAEPEELGLHEVTAPLTGIFYRSANPTSKPFVEVGDWVEPQTTVGLIETMKVFNEVAADCRGRVMAFLAEPGALVAVGKPLVRVDTEATSDGNEEVLE